MANGNQFPFAGPAATTPGVGLSPGLLGAINPRLGGLLGQMQPQQSPGILGTLFGSDPTLSAEANRKAQAYAGLMAGLQMLAASQPQAVRPGLGSILAQGIRTGREMAEGVLQQSARERLQKRIAEITEGGVTPAALQEAFGLALQSGDMEMARSIAGIFGPLAAMQGGTERKRTQVVEIERDGKPTKVLVDLDTGQVLSDIGGVPQKVPSFQRADTGAELIWYDENFQPVHRVPKVQVPRSAAEVSALASLIQSDVNYLGGFETAPNFVAWSAYGNVVTRGLVGTEDQQYLSAAQRIAANVIRMLSGAQASEKEVERVTRNFLPAPGDRPETVQVKLDQIQRLADALSKGKSAAEAIVAAEQGAPKVGDNILDEF